MEHKIENIGFGDHVRCYFTYFDFSLFEVVKDSFIGEFEVRCLEGVVTKYEFLMLSEQDLYIVDVETGESEYIVLRTQCNIYP